MAVPKYEGGEKNNKVVNRKEIDYTLLWPIALAPVIPAVGIALRCAATVVARVMCVAPGAWFFFFPPRTAVLKKKKECN